MRRDQAGHALEPQVKYGLSVGEQVERRGHGPWVESYLLSCRNNSHSEDKNLDIKVACFRSRSFHGKDPA